MERGERKKDDGTRRGEERGGGEERMAKGRKLAQVERGVVHILWSSQQLSKWPAARLASVSSIFSGVAQGGSCRSEMSKLMKPLFGGGGGGLGPVQVLKG